MALLALGGTAVGMKRLRRRVDAVVNYYSEGMWELSIYGLRPSSMESLECETEEDFIATMHAIADVVKTHSDLASQGNFDAAQLQTFLWRVQHDINHAIWKRYTHKNKENHKRRNRR